MLDVIPGIRNEADYQKIRNYWKYLKSKIKKSNSELVSATNQLKIEATDEKNIKYLSLLLNVFNVYKNI